ncbi:hypothetical protein BH18ACT11_BH18ACT11_11240 [soil metagenome]
MWGAVLRVRDIALRLLPLLVVLWATVAVLGGALYLARHAGPPDAGHTAKAGLGLCAISVAIFAGKAVRRAAIPPLTFGLRTTLTSLASDHPIPDSLSGPTATGPPIFRLLRVSRTSRCRWTTRTTTRPRGRT